MMEATNSLTVWWDLMADMHAKYGTPEDIEKKPEWSLLQEAQEDLLQELFKLTGTPTEVLFESVQNAMIHVLGEQETTLSEEQAERIVRETVRLALEHEVKQAQASGHIN